MRSLSALTLVAAMFLASTAYAQLPFPLPGGPTSKPATTEPTSAPIVEGKKAYPKPEPMPLPDGPGRDLSGAVRVVVFDAIVNPGMGEHVIEAIELAEQNGEQMVLIEIDTPGGLVTTTEKIVKAILAAKVPVVVHVTPSGAHAASAGTFITMAGHVAAMSPVTRIGAAHPVTGGGQDPEAAGGKHMAAKVENDLVALATGIAEARHRNKAWAEDAVRRSVSATAEEAEALKIIDLIAANRIALFKAIEGRPVVLHGEKVVLHPVGAPVVLQELSLRQWVLNLLASPGIAALLGVLGLLGILTEIYKPGLIIPGVMGVLCLLCSFIAVEQLPIDVGAALLILAGVGLLLAELYTPTFGALGAMGLIGLVIGLTLFVDPSDADFAIDPSVRLTMWDALPLAALLGGFVAYLSYFIATTQRGQPTTGKEGMVGATGRVLKTVGPSGGQVFVAGEYWQATSPETLEVDAIVQVTGVEDLRLQVRRATEQAD